MLVTAWSMQHSYGIHSSAALYAESLPQVQLVHLPDLHLNAGCSTQFNPGKAVPSLIEGIAAP